MNAKSKFVYNFDIYCGKNGIKDGNRGIDGQVVRKGEPRVTHVVMKLIEGNERRGYDCIVINNSFQA